MIDNPTFFVERTRKAKKKYTCCECSNTIKKGNLYNYVFAIYNTKPVQFKTCEICSHAKSIADIGGYCFGELWESLELSGYNFTRDMIKLKFLLKRGWSLVNLEKHFSVKRDVLNEWQKIITKLEK